MAKEAMLKKAYEISNAKISFVSLVDKAANKKQFLITKAENGKASFTTYGRILKADPESHFVTGIVYEPLVEDCHGNYMTEEEITKAAYWFAKNGDKVDLQHSFTAMDGATVVENFVTKSEMTIGDETIQKGTWLITVEVEDQDVWDAIQKGEITGFSMGGVGLYSEEDVNLDDIKKNSDPKNELKSEQKGIFKKLAKMFGLEVVEKGAMSDEYNRKKIGSDFWNAMSTLEDLLCKGHWDYYTDSYVYDYEQDETAIKEALTEFSEIITQILTEKSITKALSLAAPESITKAGKKMSTKNKETLDSIVDSINKFKSEFETNNEEEEEEEAEVKKEDLDQIQKMILDTIEKAMKKEAPAEPVKKENEKPEEKPAEITAESIQKMIETAVTKAMGEEDSKDKEVNKSETLTADDVQEMVQQALEPILRSRALPGNLNNTHQEIEKNEAHYLHGIL